MAADIVRLRPPRKQARSSTRRRNNLPDADFNPSSDYRDERPVSWMPESYKVGVRANNCVQPPSLCGGVGSVHPVECQESLTLRKGLSDKPSLCGPLHTSEFFILFEWHMLSESACFDVHTPSLLTLCMSVVFVMIWEQNMRTQAHDDRLHRSKRPIRMPSDVRKLSK